MKMEFNSVVGCYGEKQDLPLTLASIWLCQYWRIERVKGIEPSYEAWEASILPLNYTRNVVEKLERTAKIVNDNMKKVVCPHCKKKVEWKLPKLHTRVRFPS